MKNLLSVLLAVAMCTTLSTPALAVSQMETQEIPEWVQDGEIWIPANEDGIMPLEDFGDCPQGHAAPAGYSYQGQTIGKATTLYEDTKGWLKVVSVITKGSIYVDAADLSVDFLNKLRDGEDPNIDYIKRVFTKGNSTWYHITYAEKKTSTSYYTYVTCEAGYEL